MARNVAGPLVQIGNMDGVPQKPTWPRHPL